MPTGGILRRTSAFLVESRRLNRPHFITSSKINIPLHQLRRNSFNLEHHQWIFGLPSQLVENLFCYHKTKTWMYRIVINNKVAFLCRKFCTAISKTIFVVHGYLYYPSNMTQDNHLSSIPVFHIFISFLSFSCISFFISCPSYDHCLPTSPSSYNNSFMSVLPCLHLLPSLLLYSLSIPRVHLIAILPLPYRAMVEDSLDLLLWPHCLFSEGSNRGNNSACTWTQACSGKLSLPRILSK